MNAAAKLLAFGVILAAAFGAAAAVGAAVGPIDVGDDTAGHDTHATSGATAADLPRGLAVAQDGFRLSTDTATVAAGVTSQFGFQIVDDHGDPVTAFDVLHDRRLHLIVLSRDMVNYLHIHPTMNAGGHWSVDLPPLTPGSYRVYADFRPTGATNLTLGADITVPGNIEPVELPAPTDTSTIDEYTVTMQGTPAVGDAEVAFTVERSGQVVTTEPYLGAAGHLVAIRAGDLAYLHVHPHEKDEEDPASTSPVVTFTGEFPTAGTYRLFFDFQHDGAVRTAAFTVTVGDED